MMMDITNRKFRKSAVAGYVECGCRSVRARARRRAAGSGRGVAASGAENGNSILTRYRIYRYYRYFAAAEAHVYTEYRR